MGLLCAARSRRAMMLAVPFLLCVGLASGLRGQAAPAAPLAEYDDVPVQTVDLANVPFKGPAEAPIKVLEFADFMCPSCQGLAGAFSHYIPRSGNRVVVYFKNFPLDQACNPSIARTVHPGACNLALGAVCAHEQGKFWPYHDKVFGSKFTSVATADVVKLAGDAGLDANAMQSCLATPRAKETLAQQVAEAQKVVVTVTPTVLVNGKKLNRVSDFTEFVEKEATRLGLPPVSNPPAQP